MVYSNNLRVPVRVGPGPDLRRLEHDVPTSGCIDHVAIAMDIIRCVIDSQFLYQIKSVVDKSHGVSLFICEDGGIVAVEAFVEKPAEQVNSKLVDEVLGFGETHRMFRRGGYLPLQQGPACCYSRKRPVSARNFYGFKF